MNYEKYSRIIEKMERCIKYFENTEFSNNKYQLNLANGDTINIRYPKRNIPHLLGVNIDYLRMSNKFKSDMNSYDCLKYFISESYTFYKLVNEGKLSFDKIFSKFIEQKLDVFIDNINIRTDDMQFVLKYDREKTYMLKEIPDICDYYIVRKKSGNYILMGIVKSDTNDYIYIPATSRKYSDYYEYEEFISQIAKKQEFTYPYMMKVENNLQNYKNMFTYRVDEKIIQVDKVNKFASKFDGVASTSSDFYFTMNKIKIDKEDKSVNFQVLKLLIESIKSNNVLDTESILEIVGDVEIYDDIKILIDACNNLVCSKDLNGNSSVEYSKLNQEKEEYKQELIKARQELLELKDINDTLKKNNTILENDNEKLHAKMNIIEEAFQKVKAI